MLRPIDAYALARFVANLSWEEFKPSALMVAIIKNAPQHDHSAALRMFDPEIQLQIIKIKPTEPLKLANNEDSFDVPALPDFARLTSQQEEQAANCGHWERQFTKQIGAMLNETPISYIQAGCLWMGGLAIGRRMYIPPPWGGKVYPNLYVLLSGLSTYHHKSTMLNVVRDIINEAMPHMLIARPGSAENFVQILTGQTKTDDMSPEDKVLVQRAMPFAAQRGLIRDELSGMFRAMGKDFMAGMKEYLMEMYDCPPLLWFSTNSKGQIAIRNAAFSLFGATTPAGLGSSISDLDWRDGNLARFALITPEIGCKDRPPLENAISLEPFIEMIKTLHEKFPKPPMPNALGETSKATEWPMLLPSDARKHLLAYNKAIRYLVRPGSPLPDELRPSYGRMITRATKLTMILASYDWITQRSSTERPVIESGHWFRAIQIVEDWRTSVHALYHEVNESSYSRSERAVHNALQNYPDGLSRSALLKKSKLTAKELNEVLTALIDAGEINETTKESAGRSAKVYQFNHHA